MEHASNQPFATTHWAMVLSARDGASSPELNTLCETYWYPIYGFIRRSGCAPEDAKDLTQGFFAHLLEKNALRTVGQEKGKFRNFLLASLSHFMADQRDRAHAQKRGGAQPLLSLDAASPEERYRLEPADPAGPAEFFDQKWAQAIIDAALASLKAECDRAGKGAQFEALKGAVIGEGLESSYAEIGTRIGLSESAVKCSVPRLRRRFREHLRFEISRTVGNLAEVDEELRQLAAVMRR